MHWTTNYIGIEYVRGKSDCAHLVARVRQEVFAKPVPSDTVIERAASRLGRTAQIVDGVDEFGIKTDAPEEGDVVLMLCRGRPSHVGTYCVVGGEACVLHAMENAGMVVLHRLRDLDRYMLTVEGYYKWK